MALKYFEFDKHSALRCYFCGTCYHLQTIHPEKSNLRICRDCLGKEIPVEGTWTLNTLGEAQWRFRQMSDKELADEYARVRVEVASPNKDGSWTVIDRDEDEQRNESVEHFNYVENPSYRSIARVPMKRPSRPNNEFMLGVLANLFAPILCILAGPIVAVITTLSVILGGVVAFWFHDKKRKRLG